MVEADTWGSSALTVSKPEAGLRDSQGIFLPPPRRSLGVRHTGTFSMDVRALVFPELSMVSENKALHF